MARIKRHTRTRRQTHVMFERQWAWYQGSTGPACARVARAQPTRAECASRFLPGLPGRIQGLISRGVAGTVGNSARPCAKTLSRAAAGKRR